MEQEDLTNKPAISARGSTFPAGANSNTASEKSERSKVVVWCAQREKFLRPCTHEFVLLPACFCIPMLNFLSAGQTAPTQP